MTKIHHNLSIPEQLEPRILMAAEVGMTQSSIAQSSIAQSSVADKFAALPGATVVQAGQTLNINSFYKVETLVIMPGATLNLLPGAELVFSDTPIDTANDPEQFSHGLLVLGTINVHGSVKTPFVRLASGLTAGQQTITLAETPLNWQVGDVLLFPDSRQIPKPGQFDGSNPSVPGYAPETHTILAISGTTITLDAPLSIDHPGETDADGVWHFPHVANMTRDIIVRSENPNGTRGHVMLTGGADVDIANAAFLDLGRTTTQLLDSTTFNTDGSVKHLGTNQIGRYGGPHLHQLDPVAGREYQFRLTGSVVDPGAEGFLQGRKWGTAIHGSSDGLVQGNVYYRTHGAAIATEDGSEVRNIIDGNLISYVGIGKVIMVSPVGSNGDGIWLKGTHNTVSNNVITNVWGRGGALQPSSNNRVNLVPLTPGAPRSQWGAWIDNPTYDHWMQYTGNEIYAVGEITGFHYGFRRSPKDTLRFQNMTAWNINQGIDGFHNLEIDGFVYEGAGPAVRADLTVGNVTLRHLSVKAKDVGVVTLGSPSSSFLIEDSRISAANAGVQVAHWRIGEPSRTLTTGIRTVTIRNVQFDQAIISAGNSLHKEASPLNTVRIYWEHDGVRDRIYNTASHLDYVIPTHRAIPSQYVGLTNRQAYAQFGRCLGGEPAPEDAVTMAGVVGLVARE